MALPVCVAFRMQVPVVSSEAVVPATVQTVGVVEAKATASPELAVAARGSVEAAYCVAVIAGQVIVWLRGVTTTSCVTMGAAA